MKNDGLLGATSEGPQKPVLKPLTHDLLPKVPPAPVQAKAMISMFMLGGPSQIDLFDPKPALYKWHGKSFEGDIKFDNAAQASREIMAPLWKYRNHGQCGMELSELLPHLGGIADDITLIRSMHTGVYNHLPSNYAMTTGQHRGGRAFWQLVAGFGRRPRSCPPCSPDDLEVCLFWGKTGPMDLAIDLQHSGETEDASHLQFGACATLEGEAEAQLSFLRISTNPTWNRIQRSGPRLVWQVMDWLLACRQPRKRRLIFPVSHNTSASYGWIKIDARRELVSNA